MRPLLLLPCLLWFLPTPLSAQESDPPFLGLITAERVNVRSGPGLSYEALYQLSKGEKVRVIDRKGHWFGVGFSPEASVYVFRGYLQLMSPFSPEKPGQGRVQGRRVHIRAGAGRAFTSLGTLSDQQVVSIRRFVGDWAEIPPPDSCRGWVSASYVTYLEPL